MSAQAKTGNTIRPVRKILPRITTRKTSKLPKIQTPVWQGYPFFTRRLRFQEPTVFVGPRINQ